MKASERMIDQGTDFLKSAVQQYPLLTVGFGFGVGIICGSQFSTDINKLLFKIGSKAVLRQII